MSTTVRVTAISKDQVTLDWGGQPITLVTGGSRFWQEGDSLPVIVMLEVTRTTVLNRRALFTITVGTTTVSSLSRKVGDKFVLAVRDA